MVHELPDSEYVLFDKPALVLVIGQIRFPILPLFPEPAFVDRFYQSIREEYPKTQRTVKLALPGFAEQVSNQLQPSIIWQFSEIDGRWALVLAENALTLECRAYTSIVEFGERFVRAVECLVDTLNPALQIRLGLRYINEFRMPNALTLDEWRRYIRPEVLGLTAKADKLFDNGNVVFSRQEFELGLPDGALVIRHGLRQESNVEVHDKGESGGQIGAQGPFYLLDMDRSDSREQEISSQLIRSRLDEFNGQMYRFFRWVIREPLYQALEPHHGS